MVTSILCGAGVATGSLLVARLGFWRRDRQREDGRDPYGALQRFLGESSGPLELRLFDRRRTLRLQNPTVEQVLTLVGDEDAELWRLEGPGPIALLPIAARGRRPA